MGNPMGRRRIVADREAERPSDLGFCALGRIRTSACGLGITPRQCLGLGSPRHAIGDDFEEFNVSIVERSLL